MLATRCLIALCCFLACAGAALAAVEPDQLQALHWRSIGPFRGGRVLAVSGVPGEPEHYYFGAVNGGVWETRDAGRSWQPIFDTAPNGSIGALAVAPSDPKVIYVGTGEADMRSDIAQGAGLFKSTDAGHSWQAIGLGDSQQIGRILVDPGDADVVVVAALGHPYGANETRGVFRSTDGGKSWQRTLYKNPDTGAIDLAYEPGNPKVVYAALWQTRRPPWNVYPPSSGPGSGLYKSVDGGQTWNALQGHGLPDAPGRIGLATSPSNAGRVYALIDARDGGLYRSDDSGANWRRVSDDSRIWKRGWYFGGVTVDPGNADMLYVCNTAMYRSSDGGAHFTPVKGAPGGDDYHQLWIDPANPLRRILGVDQGAVITRNGGSSWSSWYNQPTGQFYHVITDNRFPYWVYGAQQDSGAAGIPSRTDNIDGINLSQFRETTAGGESDNIAPDPDDPQIVFGGRVDRLDLRTGQTQSVNPTLALPGLYRGTWTLPLVFSRTRSHALYFANQRVFRTIDRGRHWDAISPDLTRETTPTPANLDAPTIADNEDGGRRRGVVYALGPSPLDENLLWAGTDDGLIWRSLDGGKRWQDLTPPDIGPWSKIGVIEASQFDRDTAYVAVDRHRLDDPRPYIYRTHDGGAHWTLVADGIGDGTPLNTVNVVREDPVHRGLLYCGTESGVYVSFDDGDHWQPLRQNLPRTSVRDLQVHGDDLVIATHGRGFWIMDDVAPLRTLAGDASAATRLFPPAPAIRVRPTGFTGTPMPKDEPIAPNPPPGAYLDYAIGTASATPVTLSIYDAGGALVRRFSSTDAMRQVDLAKMSIAPEWIVPPEPLASGAGLHRFVWDLHYAVPAVLDEDNPDDPDERRGVWAPPGTYRIEMQAGGQSFTEPLAVLPDPRIKLAPESYARQFALARAIEDKRAQIATATAEAGRIHKAIQERVKSADPGGARALETADERLLAISDIAPQPDRLDALGPAPTKTGGLRYLDTAFKDLETAVDGADSTPSTDARSSFKKLQALLDPVAVDWSRFKSGELAQLNQQLKAANLEPIAP